MLETIQQGQLIDKDSAKREAAGIDQPFGRHLPMTVKDAFEMLVEVLTLFLRKSSAILFGNANRGGF